MKKILLLSTLMFSTQASESLELDLFGVSDHSNHNYDWKQENPGLGITFVQGMNSWGDVLVSAGSYIDSFHDHAKYAVSGYRLISGDREGFHATLSLMAGIWNGSGHQGIVPVLPIISVGYDWFDICCTGSYSKDVTPEKNQSGQYVSPVLTSAIGIFLKIRVLTF